MDDISALIKEAKPLYFARKKRNNRIKAALCSLCLLIQLVFAGSAARYRKFLSEKRGLHDEL